MCEALPAGITLEGWITIMLAGITLMVAILAVMIGVAAIWGCNSLKEEVIRASRNTAEEVCKGDTIASMIKAHVTLLVDQHVRESNISERIVEAYRRKEEASKLTEGKSVGETYPGGETS